VREGRGRDVVPKLEGGDHGHPQREEEVGRLERAVREVGGELNLALGVVGLELGDGGFEADGRLLVLVVVVCELVSGELG
jgi:hypothetical protein